jgi:hypothetical protein
MARFSSATYASWLAHLEAELFALPRSLYDDQVDSIAQALTHQSSRYGWDERSLKGFENFCMGLVMRRALGCPW